MLAGDRRSAIRDRVAVVYTVECAHHVARAIAEAFDEGVELFGFPNCYPCSYGEEMLTRLCTHPNVGAAIAVSLGCEGFRKRDLVRAVAATGRAVELLVIQRSGGTAQTIVAGQDWVRQGLARRTDLESPPLSELVLGVVPDLRSGGLNAGEAVGLAIDRWVGQGGRAIWTAWESAGAFAPRLTMRAASSAVGAAIEGMAAKAARLVDAYPEMRAGAACSEALAASYASTGTTPIAALLRPGEVPAGPGLYLLDPLPEGEFRFGPAGFGAAEGCLELASCGAHLVLLLSDGAGPLSGGPAPVIQIAGDVAAYRSAPGDFDLDATGAPQDVVADIIDKIANIAAGAPTAAERLGLTAAALPYKSLGQTRCLAPAA